MKKIELFATKKAYNWMSESSFDYSPGTIYTIIQQGFTLNTYFNGSRVKLEAVKTGWGNLLVKTTSESIPDSVIKFGEILIEDGIERGRNCPAETIDCFGTLTTI